MKKDFLLHILFIFHFIIPVFNTERYLSTCLDSILNQSLSNIEIICINDGSTDGGVAILDEYAAKDSRIKVVANPVNKGLMHNRKAGVDVATGEYIMFLDGDDYYSFDACEKAYNAAKQYDMDIIQFNMAPFSENSGKI